MRPDCVAWTALFLLVASAAALAGEADLPDAKPVPAMQVLPLPYDQASFQHVGEELTRFHFGPTLKRPCLYPVVGPEGRSLTRMGHPRDPVTHSHHNSVWISHQDVGGVNFWEDGGKSQIVCRRVERYEDGPESAWLVTLNAWKDGDGKVLMNERRKVEVQWLGDGQYLILLDLQWEPPNNEPLILGQTAFGPMAVRMAKTIGIRDGGGRLLNSEGRQGEPEMFRKPARWVDYSGPVTDRSTGGITLMDHPVNPSHPTPFHVRADGWMGVSLTFAAPITIEPGKPLRLRYGLWVHPGVPDRTQVDAQWGPFSKTAFELP
jgi:hypothetical protein